MLLLLALVLAACDPPPGAPAPPALQALAGEGCALLWADRPLAVGERVEWRDGDGAWRVLGQAGADWLLPRRTAAFRWVGAGGAAEVVPERPHLALAAPAAPLLFAPGDGIALTATWDGPEPPAPLALSVARDGGWLAPAGWQAVEAAFAEAAPLPRALTASWSSDAATPAVERIAAVLALRRDGALWPLARAEADVVETGRRLAWGDPHGHTNLSMDGCEDPATECRPRGATPGADVFAQAEAAGLDFAALTDHGEFAGYTDVDLGVDLSVWEESLRIAAAAEGGLVLPVLGYEWTASYGPEEAMAGGHRTVIFEGLEPCEDYVVGSGTLFAGKEAWGHERYTPREGVAVLPEAHLEALAAAEERCGFERRLSWFHHPAYTPPRPVDWGQQVNRGLGDRLVEILSEHGCSECWDLEIEGCDWQVNRERYWMMGAVQTALISGLRLGFVAGSDNHEGRPGTLDDGPGPISGSQDGDGDGVPEPWHLLFGPGGVTGALYAGEALTRPALFDALEARATLAASWIPLDARVAAVGQDGAVYLPGADVPAASSPLRLIVEVDDPAVEAWRVEVLDPWAAVLLEGEGPALDAPLVVDPGEVRYVRVRAWIAGTERRLWASPFFGTD